MNLDNYELWTVRSPEWHIPVHVKWEGDFAKVRPAISLRENERKSFNEFMQGLGGNYLHANFVMPGFTFRQNATLHEQLTPEQLFVWGKEQKPPEPQPAAEHFKLPESEASFLREFFNKYRPTATYDELVLIWVRMTAFMMDWMINKENPLDLSFCELHPVPFRPNWKNIVTQCHPDLGKMVRARNGEKTRQAIIASGLQSTLCDPYLMTYHPKERIIGWNIDVRVKYLWMRNTMNRERRRLLAGGPIKYAEAIYKTLKRLLPRHEKLATFWAAQIARPCAEFRESGIRGGFVFSPFYGKGKKLATPAKSGNHPAVVPNDIIPNVQPSHLEAKVAGLPPLPHLQPDK